MDTTKLTSYPVLLQNRKDKADILLKISSSILMLMSLTQFDRDADFFALHWQLYGIQIDATENKYKTEIERNVFSPTLLGILKFSRGLKS